MIVDTSALVAIALREPAAQAVLAAMAQRAPNRISAANLLEMWMVLDRRNDAVDRSMVEDILADAGLTVEPVTREQVEIARVTFSQYGKGSGHGARLNFGDCFAYALSKHLDEPLLFVGDDFSRTDITPVIRIEPQSDLSRQEHP